MLNLRINDM